MKNSLKTFGDMQRSSLALMTTDIPMPVVYDLNGLTMKPNHRTQLVLALAIILGSMIGVGIVALRNLLTRG